MIFMRMKKPFITAERLREILHYFPETGVFMWKQTLGSRAIAGKIAGESKRLMRLPHDMQRLHKFTANLFA